MTTSPFDFSRSIAHAYHSTKVDYDGSSCLLFNNVTQVESLAADLSKDTSVQYRISGNQNMGVTLYVPHLVGPREQNGESSKVTAIIENGKSSLEYANCSPTGGKCGVSDTSTGALNDPNRKWCMDEDVLTEQSCCLKKQLIPTVSNGRWSAPGETCSNDSGFLQRCK